MKTDFSGSVAGQKIAKKSIEKFKKFKGIFQNEEKTVQC